MKYFVAQHTSFFDPHGTGDDGGTKYFISTDRMYLIASRMDGYFGGLTYYSSQPTDTDADLEKWLSEEMYSEDSLYGQDGYNCEASSYQCVEVTDEQAAEIQKVLDAYKSLGSLFN